MGLYLGSFGAFHIGTSDVYPMYFLNPGRITVRYGAVYSPHETIYLHNYYLPT
jgi:hypothetical protein